MRICHSRLNNFDRDDFSSSSSEEIRHKFVPTIEIVKMGAFLDSWDTAKEYKNKIFEVFLKNDLVNRRKDLRNFCDLACKEVCPMGVCKSVGIVFEQDKEGLFPRGQVIDLKTFDFILEGLDIKNMKAQC